MHTVQVLPDRFPGSSSFLLPLLHTILAAGPIAHTLDKAASLIPLLQLSDKDPNPAADLCHDLISAHLWKLQHKLSNAIAEIYILYIYIYIYIYIYMYIYIYIYIYYNNNSDKDAV